VCCARYKATLLRPEHKAITITCITAFAMATAGDWMDPNIVSETELLQAAASIGQSVALNTFMIKLLRQC